MVCDELLAGGYSIPWLAGRVKTSSEKDTAAKKKASKTKFTCPECGANAWAKPDANVGCWDCQELMLAAS